MCLIRCKYTTHHIEIPYANKEYCLHEIAPNLSVGADSAMYDGHVAQKGTSDMLVIHVVFDVCSSERRS